MSLRFDTRRVREVGAVLVVLWLALVWMHPEVALRGQVYSSADAQAAAAFQVAGEKSFELGEYPFWNPFVFVGMPSYASLAHNPGVYPLTAPIKAVRDALSLPPMTWLLVHLLLLGAGMTFYLRWRGQSWTASVVGGVLLMSLPKVLAWAAYGHGTKLGTFAWFPWAMWAGEALLKQGSRRAAAALALVLGVQLLRAHVQIVYYTVLALGIFTVAYLGAELRAGNAGRRLLPRLAWLALAGVLALGLAATLYLPVLEYQGWSIRGAAGAATVASPGAEDAFRYATGWSMRWSEIASLWWPTAVGYGRASYVGGMPFTDYPHYLGFPVLLLAVVGWWHRRDRGAWALLALIVFSTLLALGRYGPFYRWAYDLLPGFQKFRVPVMILCLQHFAMLVLATAGLDACRRALQQTERPKWLSLPTAAGLGLVALVLLAVSTVGGGEWQNWLIDRWTAAARDAGRIVPPASALRPAVDLARADALRMGAILVALVSIGFGVRRRRVPGGAAVALVGLLLFLDVWRVDQPLLRPQAHLPRLAREGERLVTVPSDAMIHAPQAFDEYTAGSPLTDWLLAQNPRPRVWPILGPRGTDNVLSARGVVNLGGYHAAKLKVYEDFRRRLFGTGRPEVRLANLLGAEFVLSDQRFSTATLASLERLGMHLAPEPGYEDGDGVIYENRSAQPRAWMVHSFEVETPGIDGTASLPPVEVVDRLLRPSFDPVREAIVSADPDPLPQAARGQERVELVSETFHHLRYELEASAPALVVMSEIFYPEWKARLDGRDVPVLRANHTLRAVAVPAGAHALELRYDAARYRQGRWIRWVSLLIILTGLIVPNRSWRRQGVEGES